MSSKYLSLIITVGALLAGCASAPSPVAPEFVARIKRVSAVSVSADQFRRMHVGVTVFGNEYDQREIADWALDAEYENQLGQAAGRVFSATSVKVTYPRGDFVHANDLNGPWEAPAFWGPNWTTIEPYVKSLCSRESLDALLVVAMRKSGDFFGGTNQVLVGAGMYTRGEISLLHYLAVVSLYDCNTAKAVATRDVGRDIVLSDGRNRFAFPVVRLPEVTSRKPTSQWTPAVEDQIRSTLRDLPQASWEEALRSMVSPR